MNLVIALMVTRQFIPKSQIRHIVQGYEGQSEDTFDRMFERDKHDLRELGIRLETGTYDRLFDDEEGYRIVRDDVELPSCRLTVQESAVLSVAAQVWDHIGLARESISAAAKLKAAGVDADHEAFNITEPMVATPDASFDMVWDAVTRKIPIRFTYRRPRSESSARTVQPWAVLSWHGYWYVLGHDIDRGATRLFRLSRIMGSVDKVGRPGSYDVPADLDVHRVSESFFASGPPQYVPVLVRSGKAVGLRRKAASTQAAGNHRTGQQWDRISIGYWDPDQLAGEIAAYADDVVVDEPGDVRDYVIARLRAGADADDIT